MTTTSGYSLKASMSKLIYDPRIGELSPYNDEEIFFDSTKRDFNAFFKDDFDYFFYLFDKVRDQVTTKNRFVEEDLQFYYTMNIDKEPTQHGRSAELFFCRKDNQEVFCSFSFKVGLNGEIDDITLEVCTSILPDIKVKNEIIDKPKGYNYDLSGEVNARIKDYDSISCLSLRLNFKSYLRGHNYPEEVCLTYTFAERDKFSVYFYSSDIDKKTNNAENHYGKPLVLGSENLLIPLRIAAILVSQKSVKSFKNIEDILLLPSIEEGITTFYKELANRMMTESHENLDKKQTVLEMVNYD